MTPTHTTILERLRKVSTEASEVVAATVDGQAVLGFLLGSLYGLSRACELEYQDRSGQALPSSYPQELQGLLRDIGAGKLPSGGQWLSGFYLNSGLQRMAALYHRCLKILLKIPANSKEVAPALAQQAVKKGLLDENEIGALATVHREVNNLKHDTFGVLKGRKVDLDLAATACQQALHVLERALGGASSKSA